MSKLLFLCCFGIITSHALAQKNIQICFVNTVDNTPLTLHDSVYTNTFNENYTISKLKYYISNFNITPTPPRGYKKNVYLITQGANQCFTTKLLTKNATGISFLLGVDSATNYSGPQNGPLDPLNDMFWTWNNGYVVFKLEGTNHTLPENNNKIEHHIGGFKAPYNTSQKIYIPLPQNYIIQHKTITIQANLNKYWNSTNSIKITQNPVIATPGALAHAAAQNFINIFTLIK